MLSLSKGLDAFELLEIILLISRAFLEHLEPLVLKSFFGSKSLLWLTDQLLYQVLSFFRNKFPLFAVEIVFSFKHEK